MERRKLTGKDKVFNVFNYGVFGLLTLICAYPFYYLIINTLSANDLSAAGEILFFPKGFHLDNYKQVLKLNGIFNAAVISVARTVLGTALSVLASAFMGFMFTQERMWGRKFWYRFVVITMYFNAGMIPMFITMKNLHLTNTFWVYVIPTIVQPFNIILVKTYVESLPKSLQEAAELDGAGVLMIFWKVILPVCTPILATIAIFTAVGQWNSFQDTLIYITDQKLYSLQYLLYQYINQASSLAMTVKNSGVPGNTADLYFHLYDSFCCGSSAYLVYLSYVPETFCKGNYDGSCKRMMFLIPESFTRGHH